MNVHPGQITRLVELTLPDGGWRLMAEAHTDRGPVLGFLCAPANGTEGGIVFRPAPDEVQALAGGELTAADPAEPAQPAPPSGTLTSGQVPSAAGGGAPPAEGPDPNDPRGLRPGRDRRP